MKKLFYLNLIVILLLILSLPIFGRDSRPVQILFSSYEGDFRADEELDVTQYLRRTEVVEKVKIYVDVQNDRYRTKVEAFNRNGRFIDSEEINKYSSYVTMYSDRNMNIDFFTFSNDVTVRKLIIYKKERDDRPDRPTPNELFIGDCHVNNASSCQLSVSGRIKTNYSQIKVEVINGPVGVTSIISSEGSGWLDNGGYSRVSGVLGVGSTHYFNLRVIPTVSFININVSSGNGLLRLTLIR